MNTFRTCRRVTRRLPLNAFNRITWCRRSGRQEDAERIWPPMRTPRAASSSERTKT